MAAFVKPRATFLQRARRMLLTILIVYLLFVLAVMFCQRRLLYFPTRLTAESAKEIASREELTPWRDDSGQVIGWKLAAKASPTGSVLVIHGNAGCALDRVYFAKPIHDAAPVDVYLLEYPGYGARSGSPSQQSFLTAADEAIDLLTNQSPVYIVAESLGTGVAAHLAKTHPTNVAGILLFVPYDDLVSVAQEKMPFLPVRLILWDRFNPAAWLKDYHGPVAFVVAENDEVISPKFGKQLHAGFSGRKTLQVIPGAGHNDVSSQSPEWWKDIFLFWQEHDQTNSTRKPASNR